MGVVSLRWMKSRAFCLATPAAQAMSEERLDASMAAIVTLGSRVIERVGWSRGIRRVDREVSY